MKPYTFALLLLLVMPASGDYHDYPNKTYPYFLPFNSNSFTYSLLTDSGTPIPSSANAYLSAPLILLTFPVFGGSPGYISRTPGWGLLIPGLTP